MMGYSTVLRSSTKGEGSFSMELAEYHHVGEALQAKMLKSPMLF